MSSEFGQRARVIQMPQREGLPNAVIALWGAIQLEPLNPDEVSEVASGGSHPGILVDFLGDLERSAKAGVPVYRLAGSAGFLWAATFDQNGRGVLRYLAIDDSKIEPSRQVASNSENQAESSFSGNRSVVTRPSSQRQSQLDVQSKDGEKRLTEETDRQLTATQQSMEAQKRATIIEGAIGVFVLLCAAAMAAFLRMKRQTASSA